MAIQIRWRRDTAANWTSNNPVLAMGEPGFEVDTGKHKIGDGATAWNSLAYGQYSEDQLGILLADQASGNDPSAPAANKLLVYGKTIANRMMLRHKGPSGLATTIQPLLARNKVGYWNPPGNSTTLPGVFGYTSPGSLGTVTAANVATTNTFTRMRRLSYVSATTANAYAGQRVAVAQMSMTNGFYKLVRFGISDPSLVSPSTMFIGISSATAAPSGSTEPSNILNSLGVGHDSTDTNLKIFYAGSTAQDPIDLGADFPINNPNVDVYELALFSPPGLDDYSVSYEVTRINTGHVAKGKITGGGSGIRLPAPATLMSYGRHWRCNLASGQAVSLDIMSDYIETDN